MRVLAVIPARFGSQRLPGKPLLPLLGKPIIQHVHERVAACPLVDDISVATDDERIADCVRGFGGRAVLTRPDHPSGTDRVAEAASSSPAEIVVNVQGDEPFIEPETIAAAVLPCRDSADVPIATIGAPFRSLDNWLNPNCVKVVCSRQGFALYFSRYPLPFLRAYGTAASLGAYAAELADLCASPPESVLHHGGLYVFRAAALRSVVLLPPSGLEQAERLEQLRFLENGYPIRVVRVACLQPGIDTLEQYQACLSSS